MRTNSKPRVLIAGGAGFIGSHLCRKFLDSDFEVLCLDNFFTGARENIRDLLGNPDFELIRHDIVKETAIEADYILNFACPASPVHYQYDPVRTMQISILGSLNLLNLAKRTGARFVQASTSEVYGDPLEHPQKESYWGNVNPTGVRSCYDEGKRAAESLCFDFRRQYKTDVRVIRIFNTYGPNMAVNDGRVISNFLSQALRNQPLTIYGDGSQTRSFCFVSDLVEGIFRIALAPADLFSAPYNLGNDREFTVRELSELVIKLTDCPSEISFKELPFDDPVRRRPDLTRTRNTFDWSPDVPLEEGLRQTIPAFRKVLHRFPALAE